MNRKAIWLVLGVLIFLTYFFPRNAYKILHTKVNTQRVETIEIKEYYEGPAGQIREVKTKQNINYKFQQKMVWDELRKVYAIRLPFLNYMSSTDDGVIHQLSLFDEKSPLAFIYIKGKILIVEDHYYLIVNDYKIQLK